MTKKSVKLYTDNVLDAFYHAIRTNSLDKLHIPHSDVFYVRQAVEAYYGRSFTLKHVEDAMRAEGWSEDKQMFKAMVLACAMGTFSPETCVQANDLEGPYKTREECKTRIEEMIAGIAITIPAPMNFHYKCEEQNPEGVKL